MLRSTWNTLTAEPSYIKAYIQTFSGFIHWRVSVPVQVQVDTKPVQIISVSPQTVKVSLEKLVSKVMGVDLQIHRRSGGWFRNRDFNPLAIDDYGVRASSLSVRLAKLER